MNDTERLVKKYNIAKILWDYRQIDKCLVSDILSKFRDKYGNAIYYDTSEFPDNNKKFMSILDALNSVSDGTLEYMSKL